MSLGDHTLDELLAELAAPAPSPCGGATAAIAAAMACSLVSMVARGSSAWEGGATVGREAAELRDRLLDLARQDTEAVAGLVRLRTMEADEQAAAVERAIAVPAAIAQAAHETAALAEHAESHGRQGMRADATAARLLAEAAARAAEEVVAVNTAA